MIGAIVGDIAGSRFEGRGHATKSKDFELFTPYCRFTDDTVMSMAVCDAILRSKPDWSNLGERAVECMQGLGRSHTHRGYGKRFGRWIHEEFPQPYYSFGNGAAMRASGCGWAARSLEEAKLLSRKVTEVTHNHPEGLKGAEATAVAVFLAREGRSLAEIREHLAANYYPLDFTMEGIREAYQFDVSCQGSVPQALVAFLEARDFEDAIRNAISLGGDADTQAAIAGGPAEAFFGVPTWMRQEAERYLDNELFDILRDFEERFS